MHDHCFKHIHVHYFFAINLSKLSYTNKSLKLSPYRDPASPARRLDHSPYDDLSPSLNAHLHLQTEWERSYQVQRDHQEESGRSQSLGCQALGQQCQRRDEEQRG